MVSTVAVSIGATILTLFGASGVVALFFLRKQRVQVARSAPAATPLEDLLAAFSVRLSGLETTVDGLREQLKEDLGRANRTWSRARAAQSKLDREREDSEPDDEDDQELEYDDQGVLQFHARGSESQPVQPVSEGMEYASDADLRSRANAVLAQGF